MSSKGQFIVVVGPDGVGKSTLATEIHKLLGDNSAYFHFIPRPPYRLLPQPLGLAALVEKKRSGGSRVLGTLRITRSIVRSWVGYVRAIRPAVRNGTTVLGDRWLYGYLAQPRALKFHGPEWVARFALFLAPRPDLVVLLEAPAAVVHARKPELSIAEIEIESEVWRRSVPKALLLDATQPPGVLAGKVLAHVVLGGRFKKYPPGLGNIVLPAAPRITAIRGSSLYAPSRPRGIILHNASRLLLRMVGTAWLTTVPREDIPVDEKDWIGLVSSLRAADIPVDGVAFNGRTQTGRVGFSALTIGKAGASAFVRVAAGAVLDAECRGVSMVERSAPSSFIYPRLLLRGSCGSIEFAAYSAVLTGVHGPPQRPDIGRIISEIQHALRDLPKPKDTPSHWRPMHGDFTPWNLREQRKKLVLIDWEAAAWGPPHADETLYIATSKVLGLTPPDGIVSREAADFWINRLRRRHPNVRDRRLHTALQQALSSTEM